MPPTSPSWPKRSTCKGAVHVGHSTGGGEVARYVARAGPGRVAKAVLIGAVPPVMVKSDKNPGGLPIEVFDGFRAALAANRAQFYIDVPAGPFYGFNRPGAKVSQGVIDNWWRQGMMGGAKAHYDCIKAFSETDFTEDLKKIDVPVLVMHGDDDQIVPYRRLRAAVGQAAEEGHAEDLQGPAARHVHDASRDRQSGPARLHQGLDFDDRPPASTSNRGGRRQAGAFECEGVDQRNSDQPSRPPGPAFDQNRLWKSPAETLSCTGKTAATGAVSVMPAAA